MQNLASIQPRTSPVKFARSIANDWRNDRARDGVARELERVRGEQRRERRGDGRRELRDARLRGPHVAHAKLTKMATFKRQIFAW